MMGAEPSEAKSQSDKCLSYEERIRDVREMEYPTLRGSIYLDHAGTTPISKTLIERFSADLSTNLYGNPHSASPSSQLSTQRIESIRHEALRFFSADPKHFDLVFVANATAGIKLVADAFRDLPGGFFYGYHADAHTSLVGAREVASSGSRCFHTDEEVESWLKDKTDTEYEHQRGTSLFAFPAQSNMNGRRLPLSWSKGVRNSGQDTHARRYSLLDAAALVSTSPLDLSDHRTAPDFTVLSFYKIFGFPDLGALIVRKESSAPLLGRKYFGGGTVEMVVSSKERWHIKKERSVHSALEDGTLPIHSILALGSAIQVHRELYGTMTEVSNYTSQLGKEFYRRLVDLRHANSRPLCTIYSHSEAAYGNPATQGPIIAFNMCSGSGAWISNAEVEKLAAIHNIHLRAGGLCNPGGIASSLGLEPWEMRQNFSEGQRCGNDNDIHNGKPTGMLRVSLGAMSVEKDIDVFIAFLQEFFVEMDIPQSPLPPSLMGDNSPSLGAFHIESLRIYPIKSCGGWDIGSDAWPVKPEGLGWDREWCIIHQATGKALTQKKFPRMALIRPSINLAKGEMRIRFHGQSPELSGISVPLSADPSVYEACTGDEMSYICGDEAAVRIYASDDITRFFTSAIGTPCRLARLPSSSSRRLSKAHFQKHQLSQQDGRITPYPGALRPILLSNESPILLISRSSVNRLNEQIKARGGRAVEAEAFRPNIVLAQGMELVPGSEEPYVEDSWRFLRIGSQCFELLGSCRRCQMVCINQETAEKRREPFSTLAKTRRFDGKVWFGQHACHLGSVSPEAGDASQHQMIRVGDAVVPYHSAADSRDRRR